MSQSELTVEASPAAPSKEEGRAEILDAAAVAFMKKGFAATSINTVADALGCTKGRIYYQFESKSDLFFAVHREAMAMNLDAVLGIVRSAGWPVVRGPASSGLLPLCIPSVPPAFGTSLRDAPEAVRTAFVVDTWVFGYEDNMKLAVPGRVARTFQLVHRTSSFRVLGGSRWKSLRWTTP